MGLDFKRGSVYTRNSIYEICYGEPRPPGGSWDTGYTSLRGNLSNQLIVFINIGVPGKTGHDFPNNYDDEKKLITWYGKPKAHSEQTGDTAQAQSVVTRIDNLIAREEAKIETYEGRISTLGVSTIDVSDSIEQQEIIRDGAWDRVQGDIDYAQGQIDSLRGQLTTLDSAVNNLREKGVEVITTDEGGVFQGAETETIDYVAQANELFTQQSEQRQQIREDIAVQQGNIDRYRQQAQNTIDGANAEIKRLQQASTGDADEIIAKTDEYNLLIDQTYDKIDELKLEKFDSEQVILTLEREVGPIKYIAEVIYGQEDSVKYLDNAVRWVIYMLIFVFDPLAVLLLISSVGQVYREEEKTRPHVTEKRYVLQVPKSRLKNMDTINKPVT